MIKLYTWGTPNGKKVSIMLEEIEMPYEVYPINIGKNEQFAPEYLAINPKGRVPSLVMLRIDACVSRPPRRSSGFNATRRIISPLTPAMP